MTTASSAQNRFLNQSERSMPEALTGMPSVMVQKTALGQSSPYIRGLTGYHNVLLVDGKRLNHLDAFRPKSILEYCRFIWV